MAKQFENYIDGQWVSPSTGSYFAVSNPATRDVIGRVPDSQRIDCENAIAAASRAFKTWKKTASEERARCLLQLVDQMIANEEPLARGLTEEQGKPLQEALSEVRYATSFLSEAAKEIANINDETLPSQSPDKRMLVLKQPIGVVGCITPWNFPIAMITRKIGPAIACGCTVVVKPSEETPLSAFALAKLLEKTDFPPGVINILTGDPTVIGQGLFEDPAIRKVSFTGSTQVGKHLIEQASKQVTKLSLELGGHAPFIVFEDADIDKAVAGAMNCKFRNAGQTCISANRFYVHHSVKDAFVRQLAQQVKALKVGHGLDNGVQVGPLINSEAVAKVKRHVEDALQKGGHLVAQASSSPNLGPNFYPATLLDNSTDDMLIFQEETFGPIAAIQTFDNENEVIRKANDTPYGLAAYFYTQDAARIPRVYDALDYGIVGANDGRPSAAQAPFGGVKQSGWGREGGKYVMAEYLETKYISWDIS